MYNIYILLVLASLGLIISITYIYFFITIKKLHKSPGDIYLGMSVGEGLYSLKQLLIGIYIIMGIEDIEEKIVCGVASVFSVLGITLIYTYSLQLYLHLVIRIIHSLQPKKIQKWEGHIYSWLISIIYSSVTYFQSQLGTNLIGVCGMVVSSQYPFIYSLLIIAYVSVAISAKYYIKSQISSEPAMIKRSLQFQKYLTTHIAVQLTVGTSLNLSVIILYVKYSNTPHLEKDNSLSFESIVRIYGEYTMALLPIVFPLVRFFDPFLQKRVLYRIFRQKSSNDAAISLIKGQLTQQNEEINYIESNEINVTTEIVEQVRVKSNTQQFNSNKKQSLQRHPVSLEDRQTRPFIHQVSSQLRSSIISRVLAFLLLQEIPNACKKIVREGKSGNFDQQDEYIANDLELSQLFPIQYMSTRQFHMISYAAPIFELIKQNQELQIIRGKKSRSREPRHLEVT